MKTKTHYEYFIQNNNVHFVVHCQLQGELHFLVFLFSFFFSVRVVHKIRKLALESVSGWSYRNAMEDHIDHIRSRSYLQEPDLGFILANPDSEDCTSVCLRGWGGWLQSFL